jgi:hypothetical protein
MAVSRTRLTWCSEGWCVGVDVPLVGDYDGAGRMDIAVCWEVSGLGT